MNLVVFPLRHENPFPTRVPTGSVSKMNERTLLCCSGMGSSGVANLRKALEEYTEITTVFEFGTAAAVSKGTVGKIYECTTFCNSDGNFSVSQKSTNLPPAAVTGSDELYTGGKYDWADRLEIPLLYTMETLRFRKVTLEFSKNFCSIRLATDNGCGNIREQVMHELEKARSEIRRIFSDLTL